MNKLLKPWSLPILSGILIGTSYIPFPPWASLFCFVPLWLFWNRQTHLKNVLLGGFITAFIFTLIGFNWVAYLLHEFAHLDWPFAVMGLLFVTTAGATDFASICMPKKDCGRLKTVNERAGKVKDEPFVNRARTFVVTTSGVETWYW